MKIKIFKTSNFLLFSEKSADGILLDNTRFLRYAHLDKLEEKYFNPPSLSDRNDDQYWIFWPREAASKGVSKFERWK